LQDTVTFRDSSGLITSFYDYDYDGRDRLTKRTDMLGTGITQTTRAIEYGYDAASNQTSVTTASGTTTYSYDERNRLDLVKLNGILQADYDYDAASRLIKTTFGNNTEEVRIYDTLNRLKELTSKRTTDNVLLSKYVYTLDKVGNRKTATETVNGQNRSLAYTYDDLYRLTDEVITDVTNGNRTSGYEYDAVGNRRSKTINGVKTTYTYDANDRLLNEKVNGATTVSYSYDNNGSTLTKTENGVTTTYTWNDEKRMVSVTVGNTQQVEYTYNDQGIRVSSKVNGVETRYLLDEGLLANVWEEYATNSAVQASYVYANDLITQIQASQMSYYLVDGLGSTRLLNDAQGQVLNSYSYEAFGQTTGESGSTRNNYQYAGEQFDEILGNYYLRQRFYAMSSGRFGRMDDYEGNRNEPLSLNKYIYGSQNSINFIDPSGFTSTALETTLISKLIIDLTAIYIGLQNAVPGAFSTYQSIVDFIDAYTYFSKDENKDIGGDDDSKDEENNNDEFPEKQHGGGKNGQHGKKNPKPSDLKKLSELEEKLRNASTRKEKIDLNKKIVRLKDQIREYMKGQNHSQRAKF
jgi:RHS repeat-associated protein